jgi:hypothetical protein
MLGENLRNNFANRIAWIAFQNMSGQAIPPFSIITCDTGSADPSSGTGWNFPDPSGDGLSVTEPSIFGYQPKDPINPHTLYITGATATPAGGYGSCARPHIDVPLMLMMDPSTGAPDTFDLCGPSDGSWTGTLGAPGLAVFSSTQHDNYVLVVPSIGPYSGNLPGATQVSSGGSITVTLIGTANPATIQAVCPFDNIDTTLLNGTSLRCTVDWVWGTNQWEIIARTPGRTMIRGTLQTALSQGGSAKITTTGGATETVHEVLGTNGATIPANTEVTADYNSDTQQWEVVSTGCTAGS